jgi:hypothetical protein
MRYPAFFALPLAVLSLVTFPRETTAMSLLPKYVTATPEAGSFALAHGGKIAAVYVATADWPGVLRAAKDLQADVNRVTGLTPEMLSEVPNWRGNAPSAEALLGSAVIIGTVGKSPIIDRLAREGKIDVSGIRGKWESFVIQTVANPTPDIASALVIAGSDKRGTIYGVYDLSEQIGVSPWYWWADVTPAHQDALYVKAGKYEQGEPAVKYRGIFFNDEKPDLDYWVREKFGSHPTPNGGTAANFNTAFYAKVYEVILRLHGNYLWPAMWNNGFAIDDPENPRLADEYGVVMGSSHQEPMMRAQKEWDWVVKLEDNPATGRAYGNWDYGAFPDRMNEFWRAGISERKNFENIYTMGLRGENDSAMTGAGAALVENIVAAQRKMLAEVVNPDVTKIPQLWCLYKEVQGYYENGLRVADDITLLWAEDNWGNVRRLPTAEERKRAGGAGIYYHFDYHGGPRSYQWQNTSPIAKIWDQMSLAKQYGADRVWIVNVGHFKGYEFPTEYFLTLGVGSTKLTADNLNDYTRRWAAREFGPEHAADIADIIAKYSKYNGRRKPELLAPDTYSLTNYHEAETVLADFAAITQRAEAIYAQLPAEKRDAFYELVLFPTKASAQVNEMNVAAGLNALYARQGRASANDLAARAQAMFQADADLTNDYHTKLGDGKWNHFNDQVHIGYTSWDEPKDRTGKPIGNTMPAVRQLEVPAAAAMGVAVEGSADVWPGGTGDAVLPRFDSLSRASHFVDVFNKGTTPFEVAVAASAPWIVVSAAKASVEKEQRLVVSIDWSKAPRGTATGTVKLTGAQGEVTVKVNAFTPADVTRETLQGFAESDGYVAMEAEHYARKTDAGDTHWDRVEDYGWTLSGMRANAPVDVAGLTPGTNSPCLEYQMYLTSSGPATALLVLSPSLNIAPDRGVRVAVSFDNEAPQLVTIVPQGYSAQNGNRDWEESVKNSARIVSTQHTLARAGNHTLKVWMVDPAIVLQRVIVNTGGLKPSYLGPPESFRSAPKSVAQN